VKKLPHIAHWVYGKSDLKIFCKKHARYERNIRRVFKVFVKPYKIFMRVKNVSSEAKTEEKKVEYQKGLTPLALGLGIILVIIGTYINTMCWLGARVTLEPWFAGRIGSALYPPFALAFLLAILAYFMRGKLSAQEIAIISAMVFITMDAPFVIMTFLEIPIAATYQALKNPQVEELWELMPDYWTPKDPSLVEPLYTGGGVNFGPLMPYVSLAIFTLLLYLLLVFFIATIIREYHIKVEKIPFPNVLPLVEVVKYGVVEKSLFQVSKMIPFYVGFIIGLIVAGISVMNYIAPIFPIFFAWGQYYLGPTLGSFLQSVCPSIQGWWMFIPADVAVFYLAPLDILFTGTLWTFLCAIILPIAFVSAGIVPAGTNIGSSGPFQWSRIARYNVPIAIGVFAIIFGLKTYKESLVKAIRGEKPEPGEIPPLLMWGGFIAVFIIYLAFWSYVGVPAIVAFVALLVWIIDSIGSAKIVGESGTWPSLGGSWIYMQSIAYQTGMALGIYPSNPYKSTSSWALGAMVSYTLPGLAYQSSGTVWGFLSSYAIAEHLKVRGKDIFLAMLIALLVMTFIGPWEVLGYASSVGINKLGLAWGMGDGRFVTSKQMSYVLRAGYTVTEEHAGFLVLTFIIVGVLWFLRTKFPWFILNPVGLFFYDGMWLINVGIAFILKVITIKVFGARAYERVGVPLAVGFVTGLGLGAFLGMTGYTLMKAP